MLISQRFFPHCYLAIIYYCLFMPYICIYPMCYTPQRLRALSHLAKQLAKGFLIF